MPGVPEAKEDRITMSYNDVLAERVRAALAGQSGVKECQMFGGLSFLLRGHMCCGVVGDDVVIRVGPDDYRAALAEPHAREMDFTGRALKGFVYVSAQGVASEESLQGWVRRALRFASVLPAKSPVRKVAKRKRR
jgi:TfoX/Sxy family transcriptional regulator of competence genes